MRERKFPGADIALLIDFLNIDFETAPDKAVRNIPDRRRRLNLRLLLETHDLSSRENRERGKLIQHELRNVVFQYRPDGKRELSPLVDEINRYATKPVFVVNGAEPVGVKLLKIQNSGDLRKDLFQTVSSALMDGTFLAIQRCANEKCGWVFFGKTKFHRVECGRAFNRATAKHRMEQLRKFQRLKEIKPKLIKLRRLAEQHKQSEILAMFPELKRFDAQLLSEIIEGEKPLSDLMIKGRNRKILVNLKLTSRKGGGT